jgi:hypothetical protein
VQAGAPADVGAAVGEDDGRQDVRGLVAELAREIARLAQHPAALERRSSGASAWLTNTSACSSGGPERSRSCMHRR